MPIAGFTRGTETVGGGDAILINDEMVMRDFVARSTLTTVEDNGAFLRSVPDFNELILDISEVAPEIGYSILTDLMASTIYLSEGDLKILPSDQTSINGPQAQVQIALRHEEQIILGPQFRNLKDKAYLMVHEALHGLLEDAEGPFHHGRVRSVIKYLKDNRDNYEANSFQKIFLKNKYIGLSKDHSYDYAFLFLTLIDPTVASNPKCFAASTLTLLRNYVEFAEPCPESTKDIKEAFNIYFKALLDTPMEINEFIEGYSSIVYSEINEATKIELPDVAFFHVGKKERQKDECRENSKILQKSLLDLEVIKKVKEVDLSLHAVMKTLPSAEVTGIKYYLWDTHLYRESFFNNSIDRIKAKLESIREKIKVLEKNEERCQAKFGSDF